MGIERNDIDYIITYSDNIHRMCYEQNKNSADFEKFWPDSKSPVLSMLKSIKTKTEIVEVLHSRFNFDFKTVDANGNNALYYAGLSGNMETVKLVHGIDNTLCLQKNNNGESVIKASKNYRKLYQKKYDSW